MILLSALLLSEYSFWWIILIFSLALALSLWLYSKKKTWSDTPKAVLFLMMALRFMTLFGIGFLLLKPLFNNPKTELYKAQLIVLQDQSKSILLAKDSLKYSEVYNQRMNAFTSKLEEADLPYKLYGFSDSLFLSKQIVFNQGISDISNAIKKVSDYNSAEYIGGIVLLSDGIYNKGEDPFYANKNSQLPIFTIGLGDTSTYSDIKIENININKVTYSNRNIPFSVDLKAVELNGKKHIFKILENDKVLFEQPVSIKNKTFFATIDKSIAQLNPGMHILRFAISIDEKENNIVNNERMVSINVVDSKQKVLILSASPHPDIAALKSALKKSQTFEVEQYNIKDFKGQVDDYNLLILHQLPNSSTESQNLLSKISESKTSMLFFVSPQTDIRQLDQWNKQSKITKSLDKNEWLQASYNNNFKLFNISKELADYIEQVPPLISPMIKIQKLGNVDILANQKIRNIATEQALIYFSENEDQKKAFILGEGIWKWKMYDFQINGNFSNFSEIFEKTVQYLCIETPKNNLLVDIKNQYLETESIRIKAQYYNKSLELNLDQNLNFEYSNSEGQSFSKPMQIENNQYQIDLPYLGKGIYSYNIKSGKDSSKVLSSGSFSVLPSQLELLDTKARHTLLSKISEQTQGKFYSEADWFKLIEEIKNHPKFKTKSYTSYLLEEWINFRWILWIIMLLISLEWFLRKYLGSI